MIMSPESFDRISLFAFATTMEFSKVFPEDFNRIVSHGPVPENSLIPLKGRHACACVVGVGILDFSVGLSHVLCECRQSNIDVSAVVNLGICGAYPGQALSLLDVVCVESDSVGDLGVQERDGSLTHWVRTYRGAAPEMAPQEFGSIVRDLRPVAGTTVNCCTGTESTARHRVEHLHCQVESMEGAACFAVCEKFGVPAFQIRAVSNMASTRDKSQWRIDEALQKLHEILA